MEVGVLSTFQYTQYFPVALQVLKAQAFAHFLNGAPIWIVVVNESLFIFSMLDKGAIRLELDIKSADPLVGSML